MIFLQKLSRHYINNYDVIYVENLEVKIMIENKKNSTLNRHIHDSAWSKFLSLLAFKAEGAENQVVRVKPRNTSRGYPNCGNIVENFSLKDRLFACPKCGWEANRDYNASLNILYVGLGAECPWRVPLLFVISYRSVI